MYNYFLIVVEIFYIIISITICILGGAAIFYSREMFKGIRYYLALIVSFLIFTFGLALNVDIGHMLFETIAKL